MKEIYKTLVLKSSSVNEILHYVLKNNKIKLDEDYNFFFQKDGAKIINFDSMKKGDNLYLKKYLQLPKFKKILKIVNIISIFLLILLQLLLIYLT